MRIANNGLLTETNLTLAATDMKSQAYAPLWHDGPCLLKLQPARDFVASGSQFFFPVRKLLTTFSTNTFCAKG